MPISLFLTIGKATGDKEQAGIISLWDHPTDVAGEAYIPLQLTAAQERRLEQACGCRLVNVARYAGPKRKTR